jgi:uncharacterized alpha-E superfamily protein
MLLSRVADSLFSSAMWEQLNALFLRTKQMREDGSWGARIHHASLHRRCSRGLAGYSTRTGGRAERLAGRLRASLEYAQGDEILNDDPQAYLTNISRQCSQIHAAVHQSYVSYPIESALPA